MIIGIGYRARQGKNIFCDALKRYLPSLRVYAFADELKRYCAENHEQILIEYPHLADSPQKPDSIYGFTKVLQFVGTQVFRAKDPDYWVKKVAERIDSDKPQFAAITDCRFENEAEFIKKRGGLMVELVRLNPDGTRYFSPDRDPNHPSECSLEGYPFDVTVSAVTGDLAGIELAAEHVANRLTNLAKSSTLS